MLYNASKPTKIEAGQKLLAIDDISVQLENRSIVRDASFTLERGEIGCLLGPSGCGKSTLLRTIAGFEKPVNGTVSMQGRALTTPSYLVNPENRNIGMVFQDFALFPHVDVTRNVAFGLRNWPKDRQKKRVRELLELVELTEFSDRYPHSLSGGEQQRVALARAMAPKPSLLLLDEAFSSLDIELRQALVPVVRKILQQEGVSAILVTHDQSEAFAIADRVGVMNKGRILQWDNAYNLYHCPASRFVADFIGEGKFLSAVVVDDRTVKTVLGLHQSSVAHDYYPDDRVDLLIRPEDMLHDDNSAISGEIFYKSFRGSHFLYHVRLPNGEAILCFADSHHNHAMGERIGVTPNVEHLVLFLPQGSE